MDFKRENATPMRYPWLYFRLREEVVVCPGRQHTRFHGIRRSVEAGSLAKGFGATLTARLLGGSVRYFKTTRRLLHKLTFGSLFK